MDEIQKKSLKVIFKDSMLYGFVISIFVGYGLNVSLERYLYSLLPVLLLSFSVSYSVYYSSNMKHHLLLKKKHGQKYLELVDEEMRHSGISKMLKSNWFLAKAGEDENGNFL